MKDDGSDLARDWDGTVGPDASVEVSAGRLSAEQAAVDEWPAVPDDELGRALEIMRILAEGRGFEGDALAILAEAARRLQGRGDGTVGS
jgi:hypothetical protein